MGKRIEHRFSDDGEELKWCSYHKEWHPLHDFTKRKSNWDNLGPCKEQAREYDKKSRDKAPKIPAVYALHVGDRFTVGKTTYKPGKLRSRYQTHNGYPVTLVLYTYCGSEAEALKLERELHECLMHRHVHGEWFQKSDSHIYEHKPEIYHTHANRRKYK